MSEQFDFDEAAAFVRAGMQSTDSVSLATVAIAEDYERGVMKKFDRDDWPTVANALLVSSAMLPSLTVGRPDVPLIAQSYVAVTVNMQAVAAVLLLDRFAATAP